MHNFVSFISCSIILTRSGVRWWPRGWKYLYIYPFNWFVLSYSAQLCAILLLLLHQLNEKLSSANSDCFTADVNTMIWPLRLHLRQDEPPPLWSPRECKVRIKTQNLQEPADMIPCSLSQDPWICKDRGVFVLLTFLFTRLAIQCFCSTFSLVQYISICQSFVSTTSHYLEIF